MAKITGPLFSMDARGKFAGAVVFSNWKGRPTARQLVIPANPRTTNQQLARYHLAVVAAAMKQAQLTTEKYTGPLDAMALSDKAFAAAAAPAGQSWAGHYAATAIGKNGVAYAAAGVAYAALDAQGKTNWDNAAGGLSPPILAVATKIALGAPGPTISAGEVFFRHIYTMFLMGAHTNAPTATAATYG
jgi:hypothetical protein